MDSLTLGGCKWISQRLCTVGFLSAFLNFHLFFFHLHPGLGPVLLGWLHLNVITDNGKSQAQSWATSHKVTSANGVGGAEVVMKASIAPLTVIHKSFRHQCIKFKFCETLGYLQLSQWLLQTSQKFLKINQISSSAPLKISTCHARLCSRASEPGFYESRGRIQWSLNLSRNKVTSFFLYSLTEILHFLLLWI